jgi:hypothetical protein
MRTCSRTVTVTPDELPTFMGTVSRVKARRRLGSRRRSRPKTSHAIQRIPVRAHQREHAPEFTPRDRMLQESVSGSRGARDFQEKPAPTAMRKKMGRTMSTKSKDR